MLKFGNDILKVSSEWLTVPNPKPSYTLRLSVGTRILVQIRAVTPNVMSGINRGYALSDADIAELNSSSNYGVLYNGTGSDFMELKLGDSSTNSISMELYGFNSGATQVNYTVTDNRTGITWTGRINAAGFEWNQYSISLV